MANVYHDRRNAEETGNIRPIIINKPDKMEKYTIELELRFLEEREQDLTRIYERGNDVFIDFDPNDHSIWGILTKEISAESNTLSLDFTNIKDINFETELLVWSVNRKIVKMLYPTEGVYDGMQTIPPVERYYLKAILSKEYYPNMVFYYAIDKVPYSGRIPARVYDEYTQVEE